MGEGLEARGQCFSAPYFPRQTLTWLANLSDHPGSVPPPAGITNTYPVSSFLRARESEFFTSSRLPSPFAKYLGDSYAKGPQYSRDAEK